jgi:hypothetical protein
MLMKDADRDGAPFGETESGSELSYKCASERSVLIT